MLPARGGGEDAFRAGSPGEALGVCVVLDDVAVDGILEVDERAEEASNAARARPKFRVAK